MLSSRVGFSQAFYLLPEGMDFAVVLKLCYRGSIGRLGIAMTRLWVAGCVPA